MESQIHWLDFDYPKFNLQYSPKWLLCHQSFPMLAYATYPCQINLPVAQLY